MDRNRAPSPHEVAAWVAAAALLYVALRLRLLPALLSGLLVYELVHITSRHIGVRTGRGRVAAAGLLATLVVGALLAAMFGLFAFIDDAAGPAQLLQNLAQFVENSRSVLPAWIVDRVPGDPTAMKAAAIEWLRTHAAELRVLGGEIGHFIVNVLIGMAIGAIISVREAKDGRATAPLARALLERAERFAEAFRRVVFAQVRISAINTVLTAIYLLAALPLFGVQLPFAKTLVAVTFLAGLLPVVGNLISNTAILLVSLGQSPLVAAASFAYLVVIHKLEYFLNAEIVGSRIHAAAWELLLAMLVMEAAFGLYGLVAAPIYYAYLKDELASRGLV